MSLNRCVMAERPHSNLRVAACQLGDIGEVCFAQVSPLGKGNQAIISWCTVLEVHCQQEPSKEEWLGVWRQEEEWEDQ